MVHLISGMLFMLGINEPPTRVVAMGGIRRFKDGRNMPDVHMSLFEYGDVPVYMRLNLGSEMPEVLRFQGSKGILELTETSLTFTPPGRRRYRTQLLHVQLPAGACARSTREVARRERSASPARNRSTTR